MKRIMAITLLMILHVAFGDERRNQGEEIRQIKDMLVQIENSVPERSRDIYYFSDHVNRDWKNKLEFSQLTELVAEKWEDVLRDTDGIASLSEIHQLILFESFCFLPQKDAFLCLNKTADLALGNIISQTVFRSVIVGHDVNNKDVLVRNYKDPVVAEVLRKASKIDPEQRDYYKWMASGAAKRELEHPLYYDTDTNTSPNIASVKSWAVFLGRILIRVVVVAVAVIGAVAAWRCFRKRKKRV